MDLLRVTRGGEPIGDPTSASQDAAAEHHGTRDGRGPDGGEGPRERVGRVVEDAVGGLVPVTSNTSPA